MADLQTQSITANGSKGHHKFTLTMVENSTDVATNKSKLTYTLKLAPIQSGWDWSMTNAMSYNIKIGTTSIASGYLNNYNGSSTVTVATGVTYITHNTDGKKSVSYSFEITSLNYSYLPGSASKSGTMTLTDIARKAILSTAQDFNDEENPTITYSNPAGSAVEALEACISWTGFADIAYRPINKTGELSYTFNFTQAEREKLWTAVTSGYTKTVKFYIRTTIGGEYYYHTMDKTLTLINASPTISPTVVDVGQVSSSLTGDPVNKMIRWYNSMLYNANAVTRKGATIKSAVCTNGGKNYSGTSGNIYSTGDNKFIITVTDSRENTATQTITKSMVNYTNLTVDLSISTPVISGDTCTMNLDVSGHYWGNNFGTVTNTLNVEFRHKDGTGEWSDWEDFAVTIDSETGKYSGSTTYLGSDYKQSYTFQARAYDKVHQLQHSDELYTPESNVRAVPVFDWGSDDFNFNVPVTIQEGEVPSILEQGTDGDWYYRKWSDGVAECWANKEVTVSFPSTANWGVLYTTGAVADSNLSFPFTFIEIPVVTTTLTVMSAAAILIPPGGTSTKTSRTATGAFELARPSAVSGSAVYTINYQVKGKWK